MIFLLQITFNNPIKAYYSNEKYNCKIIKLGLTGFSKVISVQNQFPTSFGTALILIKTQIE